MVDESLKNYIENNILPLYDHFDAAHQRNHVDMVIEQSVRIVAEADRFIDPDTIILRTVQYGLANYPELDKEGHWQRTLDHLHEEYAEGGYLRLWFENSPNVARLNALREIIKNESLLLEKFDYLYEALTNLHLIGCTCSQCQPTKYRKAYGH